MSPVHRGKYAPLLRQWERDEAARRRAEGDFIRSIPTELHAAALRMKSADPVPTTATLH